MNKKFYSLVFAMVFGCALFAQNVLNTTTDRNTQFSINQTDKSISIDQEFNYLAFEKVYLNSTEFYKLDMGEGFSETSMIGAPNLPVFNSLVSVPVCSEFVIEERVLETETIKLKDNILIAPKQMSQSKQNEEVAFSIDEKYYNSTSFDKSKHTSMEVVGVMGGIRLARLSICPIKYNPSNNTIVVAKKISVTISYKNIDEQATKRLQKHENNATSNFVKARTINKLSGGTISTTNRTTPYVLVIVSPDSFQETLQPFIAWKKQQGFNVIEAYTSQTGTSTSSIKSYLSDLYNSETSFDYLIICGDTPQIPAFTGVADSHVTDLNYAEFTDDYLPDVFYGRLSARTTSSLQSILNKTITYEKYLFEEDNFLNSALLVAGVETTQTTITNGHVNYAKDYVVARASDTSCYYNPNSGNQVSEVLGKINQGQSWINYTAHCSSEGWYQPAFRSSNVNSLTNTGKYSFLINNCCQAGMYGETECFSEKVVRADNKGAVASIAASNYTYWNEDFYWAIGNKTVSNEPSYNANHLGAYDKYFHTHNEARTKQYITAGQIMVGGNLAVEESNSSLKNYYWEVYNLMGDPTLMPYVGVPQNLAIAFEPTIPAGQESFIVTTEPYAYVALSKDGVLFDAQEADENGQISFNLSSIVEPCVMQLVATAQFRKPLFDSINIISNNNPYIIISDLELLDADNNNAVVDKVKENTNYNVRMKIKNCGTQAFQSTQNNITFTNEDNMSAINSLPLQLSYLGGNSDTIVQAGFSFTTTQGIQDGQTLSFTAHINGGEFSREQAISFDAAAPMLAIENLSLTLSENNTYEITFNLKNTGSIATQEGELKVDTFITQEQIPILQSGELIAKSFSFENTENIDSLEFEIIYIAGSYGVSAIYTLPLRESLETFETRDFESYNWNNNTSLAWVIDTVTYYEGNASARSAKNMADNESSKLSMVLNVMNNDTISFYYKTSTETNYDKLYFIVDEDTLLTKSGDNNWTLFKRTISAGIHTLQWLYVKDYSQSAGSDCVWIDNVKMPLCGTVVSSISTDELANEDGMKVYPNPAKDFINVEGLKDCKTLQVYDITGKLVLQKTINNDREVLNVSNFENGTYYIISKEEKIKSKKKIIISK